MRSRAHRHAVRFDNALTGHEDSQAVLDPTHDPLRPAVLFFCPDSNVPTGGIAVIYRHVEHLNDAGINAAVLHTQPGFRCRWFQSSAPVVATPFRPVTPDDVLVIPEVSGPNLHEIGPGTPKVVFNQNAHYTFNLWPTPGGDARRITIPYRSPEVVASIVVSEHSREYLQYAFPGIRVYRTINGVHSPDTIGAKDDLITYLPRKNEDHALQVLNLLENRASLGGFAVEAIDGVDHEHSLESLRRTRIFLSFGYPEGCALPPLEAMAAGCLVVGYDGVGCREYLTPETSYPVPFGDIVTYARTVEAVLDTLRSDPASVERRIAAGRALVQSEYSTERERASVVSTWREILATVGHPSIGSDSPRPSGPLAARFVGDLRAVELEQLGAERDHARAERDDARAELAALRTSRSWRLTHPLRALAKAMRGRDSRAEEEGRRASPF